MTPEQLKQKVKEAFSDVDSEEFLQKKIKECLEGHRIAFRRYMENHPESSFEEWKNAAVEACENHQNNNEEILVIGIFLLALDEFEKEQS